MSIPAEGYLYSQCHFKQDDKEKIDKILSFVQSKLASVGLEKYLETGSFASLDFVPSKVLNEITNGWDKLLSQMELISFKMAIVKEFRMIRKLIDESRNRLIKITEITAALEEDLRKDYSQTVSANSFFSDYFSFKEFKNTFSIIAESEDVTLFQLNDLKSQNIFQVIRKKIISNNSNIHALLSESSKIVHINSIKQEDERTYNLLRSEFFTTVSNEALGIKIPYGKKTQTEIIRPSHKLAEILKLERTEIVYLTVSIDPIPDMEFDAEQVIEFNNGMKFDFTKNQQVIKREMFYQLSLDKDNTCNLLVPIYFSLIRCNLVKEQRSSFKKINDSSLIEDVNPTKK